MIRFGLRCVICTVVSVMPATLVWADDLFVSGFGTLAYSYEMENKVGHTRDIAQPPDANSNGSFLSDSNFGVQLDYEFNPTWSVTTQFVLEDRVENKLNDLTELAFIRYVPNASWDLRIGRLGLNAYNVADSRRIGFAHLWVRPPKELYGGIFYDSIDGVDMTYRQEGEWANWSVTLQYGLIEQSLENEATKDLSIARSDSTYALAIEVDKGPWSGRASFVNVSELEVLLGERSKQAQQGIADLIATPNLPSSIQYEAQELYEQSNLTMEKVQYYQLGLDYFDGIWHLHSELFRVEGAKAVVPEGLGGYVMLGYTLSENITPFGIFGSFKPDRAPFASRTDWGVFSPQLGEFQQLLVAGINTTHIEQTTYSVGFRWDLSPQVALKAQYDHIDLEANGYGLWAAEPEAAQRGRAIQLFTLGINFIF